MKYFVVGFQLNPEIELNWTILLASRQFSTAVTLATTVVFACTFKFDKKKNQLLLLKVIVIDNLLWRRQCKPTSATQEKVGFVRNFTQNTAKFLWYWGSCTKPSDVASTWGFPSPRLFHKTISYKDKLDVQGSNPVRKLEAFEQGFSVIDLKKILDL